MTNEEWAEAEKSFFWTGAFVKLDCDGYQVTVRRERIKPLVDCFFVYVNGRWDWKWCQDDCEERRRFARPKTYFVHTPKERMRLKKLSKTTRKLLGPYFDPDKKITIYEPVWRNFKALKAHFVKNNKQISLVEDERKSVTALPAIGA